MLRNGIAILLSLIALAGAARAGEERIELSSQPGMSLPILYDGVPDPIAALILLIGGDGDIEHEVDSFLLRVRGRFVAAGMSVAVPDTPSDHPGGFGPLYRTWEPNIEDIAAVVAFLKRASPAPVFAVGTSNGTISAAAAAAALGERSIAGVVLTSSVWLGGLADVPVGKIDVPVLVISNRDDTCPAARFDLAAQSLPLFTRAPAKQFIAVEGGGKRAQKCGSGSPHDFWGIENQVVPPIIAWIKRQRQD